MRSLSSVIGFGCAGLFYGFAVGGAIAADVVVAQHGGGLDGNTKAWIGIIWGALSAPFGAALFLGLGALLRFALAPQRGADRSWRRPAAAAVAVLLLACLTLSAVVAYAGRPDRGAAAVDCGSPGETVCLRGTTGRTGGNGVYAGGMVKPVVGAPDRAWLPAGPAAAA